MSRLSSAAVLAAAAKALKDGGGVFSSAIKRAAGFFKSTYKAGSDYGNGAALTPPMGWSSWNLFGNRIDENLIYEMGKALVDSKLADCGYKYLNIDDCWQSSVRDENGRLQGDLVLFPNGIRELAKKVNALGLKLGIYSCNGPTTCEDMPGSLGNEAADADAFAEWGIEYLKYDFCHNIPIPFLAPNVEKIIVSAKDASELAEYAAAEAALSGGAKIVDDPKLESGKYVAGLGGGGACEFKNVAASRSGEYVLTLVVRKKLGGARYAEILVNGEDLYRITVPPTRAFLPDGRRQLVVRLKKGANTVKIYNPVASRADSAAAQYTNMGAELKRASREYAEKRGVPEKPIVFSICEWGRNLPWRWGAGAGNLWRTAGDIGPSWSRIRAIYEFNVRLYKYAGPGRWNDPDMLEVGVGNLTYEENRSHFTLWCMMAAPLVLGLDARRFVKPDGEPDVDDAVYKIIANKDLIALDQDALGAQCRRISTNGAKDVLVKPLSGGEFAVCFFNKASTPSRMSCSLRKIVFKDFVSTPAAKEYEARDLWSGEEFVREDVISARVPARGVRVFRIGAKKDERT